jgi:hypothetical protein
VKYTEALRAMREDCPNEVVLRKAWASVVGRFQHVAEVVQGGQQLLAAAYDARQNFVGLVPEREQPAGRFTLLAPTGSARTLLGFPPYGRATPAGRPQGARKSRPHGGVLRCDGGNAGPQGANHARRAGFAARRPGDV